MVGKVGSGLSYGAAALADHATTAVRRALARAGLDQASAVVLFLTHDYAHNPEPALRAAARAAGCTQVFGATASGILTDEEWVLDSKGAAALVLGPGLGLAPRPRPGDALPALSLCTPQGLSAEWLDAPVRRLGAVSADILGQGPSAVWNGGRVAAGGAVDAVPLGVEAACGVAQGIRALTAPIEVAEVHGHELMRLGNYPALNVLVTSLPARVRRADAIPLHLLIGGVTFGDPDTAISEGRYRLNHIVAADSDNLSITLSSELEPGARLFWAMRDSLAAERGMRALIDRTCSALSGEPDFAVLFPCATRGPAFFGNRDRDLELLRTRFPRLPVIGCYGAGEIGPLNGGNHLHEHSTVLGLFRAER